MANAAARLLAGAPAFLFRSHFRVSGNSMTPRLRDGDLLHVIPRVLSDSRFARGAVVVARSPALDGGYWIKRVVGLPGEFLSVAENGDVFIDDVLLSEPYRSAAARSQAQPSAWLCDDDEYFLMGDNRADSSDSRRYGPVHRSAIVGRVWLRWSSRRVGLFRESRPE